jgi:mono/diheme cytochrome c family protein
MKKVILIFVMGFLFSCSENKTNTDKILSGKKIYSNNCASCHESGMLPNLSLHRLELFEVILRIKYGNGIMPSYEGTLSEKEIEDVAYYIYKLN